MPLTRETLPQEGTISEDIAPLLRKGDLVYFDPVPNLRLERVGLGSRGPLPKGYNYIPRKGYPKTGWYPLLKDPYLEYPGYKIEPGDMHQFKIQELGNDNIRGAIFGSHWFFKYRLVNSEPQNA